MLCSQKDQWKVFGRAGSGLVRQGGKRKGAALAQAPVGSRPGRPRAQQESSMGTGYGTSSEKSEGEVPYQVTKKLSL
jgi:hypothetical protein